MKRKLPEPTKEGGKEIMKVLGALALAWLSILLVSLLTWYLRVSEAQKFEDANTDGVSQYIDDER